MPDDKKQHLTDDEKVAAKRAEEDAAIARANALHDVNLDVSLAGVTGLVPTILHLIELGITADQMAERLAALVDPGAVPALETLAKVLQAAAALLKKV